MYITKESLINNPMTSEELFRLYIDAIAKHYQQFKSRLQDHQLALSFTISTIPMYKELLEVIEEKNERENRMILSVTQEEPNPSIRVVNMVASFKSIVGSYLTEQSIWSLVKATYDQVVIIRTNGY